MEKTFIMIKPDAVEKGLIGEIISWFEDEDFKILRMQMMRANVALSRAHYKDHVEKPFYPNLEKFITSGPVVALELERENAVALARGLMGETNPEEADYATIRGAFGTTMTENAIHGSDSVESAEREISLWFESSANLIGEQG